MCSYQSNAIRFWECALTVCRQHINLSLILIWLALRQCPPSSLHMASLILYECEQWARQSSASLHFFFNAFGQTSHLSAVLIISIGAIRIEYSQLINHLFHGVRKQYTNSGNHRNRRRCQISEECFSSLISNSCPWSWGTSIVLLGIKIILNKREWERQIVICLSLSLSRVSVCELLFEVLPCDFSVVEFIVNFTGRHQIGFICHKIELN